MLLGTDVPHLVTLLDGVKGKVEAVESVPDEALALTTCSQSQRDVEETMLREQREMDSGVQPMSVEDELEHAAVSGEELEEMGLACR